MAVNVFHYTCIVLLFQSCAALILLSLSTIVSFHHEHKSSNPNFIYPFLPAPLLTLPFVALLLTKRFFPVGLTGITCTALLNAAAYLYLLIMVFHLNTGYTATDCLAQLIIMPLHIIFTIIIVCTKLHAWRFGGKKRWRMMVGLSPELRKVIKISWPMMVQGLFTHLLTVTDLAFVGHVGKKYLAAASLALSMFDCLIYFVHGSVTAHDTLASMAFGSQNHTLRGQLFFQAIVMVVAFMIPVHFLVAFPQWIFLAFPQEENIAELSTNFMRLLCVGIFPSIMFKLLVSFEAVQEKVLIPVTIVVLSFLVNLSLNFLFVIVLGWGYVGSPIATVCCYWFQMITIAGWIVISGRLRGIFKPSWDYIRPSDMWRMFSLGISGGFMTVSEVIGWELLTLLAGMAGESVLAAHAILLNIAVTASEIAVGLSCGIAVRVGINLGKRRPVQAKRVALAAPFTGLILSSTMIVMIITGNELPIRLFTDDREVISMVKNAFPVFFIVELLDMNQIVVGGVIRGTGKQISGAVMNSVSYFLVGLSTAVLLLLVVKWKPELNSIWLGVLLAAFVLNLMYFFIIFVATRWNKLAEEAYLKNLDLLPDSSSEEESSVEEEEEDEFNERSALITRIMANDEDMMTGSINGTTMAVGEAKQNQTRSAGSRIFQDDSFEL